MSPRRGSISALALFVLWLAGFYTRPLPRDAQTNGHHTTVPGRISQPDLAAPGARRLREAACTGRRSGSSSRRTQRERSLSCARRLGVAETPNETNRAAKRHEPKRRWCPFAPNVTRRAGDSGAQTQLARAQLIAAPRAHAHTYVVCACKVKSTCAIFEERPEWPVPSQRYT